MFAFNFSIHSQITFKAVEFIDLSLFACFDILRQLRLRDLNYQIFVVKALA